MSAKVDATLITEPTGGLAPGIYTARAQDPAYGWLEAMVVEERAEYLGERHDSDGTKFIAVAIPETTGSPTALTPNVAVTMTMGAEYFTTFLKEYKDWREKWWREAIQNSVDAGATQIDCRVEAVPEGFAVSVTDNGRGMDEDTIINKFLHFGGTTKTRGDTRGGFGKAKELLVLPWLAWSLHTRDRMVTGVGIQTDVAVAPYRNGTEIRVIMPPDETTHESCAMAYIQKCELPDVRFTVNGERFKANLRTGEELRDFVGKAKLYYDKKGKMPGLYVRTMGLFMFQKSQLSESVKGTLIVELTGSSVDLLTANRDGFRDDSLDWAINDFVNELAADVSSALEKKKGLIREKFLGTGKFRGATEQEFQATMLNHLEELQPAEQTKRGLTLSLDQVTVIRTIVHRIGAGEGSERVPDEEPGKLNMRVNGDMAAAMLDATVMPGPAAVEAALKQLAWEPDFYLINRVEDFRVPKMFYPQGMTPGVKKLARAWAELCRFVLIQLGCSLPYGVGFIFHEQTAAAYLREETGERWLLLNPFRVPTLIGDQKPSKDALYGLVEENDVNWLYAAAIHECTHMADGVKYHDESFTSAFTRNVGKTANKDRQVKAIIKAIKARGPKAPGAAPRDKKAPAFALLADASLERARVDNAWKGGAEYVLFTQDNKYPYEHSSSEGVLKTLVLDNDLGDAEIRKAGGKVVWRAADFGQPLAETKARGKKATTFPPLYDTRLEQVRQRVTLDSGYRYGMFVGDREDREDFTDDLTSEALGWGTGRRDVEWRDQQADGRAVWRGKDFSQPLAGGLPPLADADLERERRANLSEYSTYSLFALNEGTRSDSGDELQGLVTTYRSLENIEIRDSDGNVVYRSSTFTLPLAGAGAGAGALPLLADEYDEQARQEAAREHARLGSAYVSFKDYTSGSVWDYSTPPVRDLIKRSQADITNDEIYFEIRDTTTGLPVWRSENFGLRLAKSHTANRAFQGMDLSVADMDPDELLMGTEHEMEHTDDPDVAEQIALDHLAEDPHYYSRLASCGIDGNLRPNARVPMSRFDDVLSRGADPGPLVIGFFASRGPGRQAWLRAMDTLDSYDLERLIGIAREYGTASGVEMADSARGLLRQRI